MLDRIENFTLHWFHPPFPDFGGDVLRYEIYLTKNYITNVSGLLPNGTIVGQIYPNGTIWELPNPFCYFSNLPDGTWYVIIIAYDELGNPSPFLRFNWTVDTTPPTIENITNLTGLKIFAGQPIPITVNAFDAVGINRVWLNYTLDGIMEPPILMEFVFINPNNTLYSIFSGNLPGFQAGQTINYSITVYDFYGHSVTSASFVFTVLEKDFSLVYILLLIVIGGTLGAAIVVYRRLRAVRPKVSGKSKEKEGRQEKSLSIKSTLITYGKKIPKLFNWKKKKK